jgi:hypothetical protein
MSATGETREAALRGLESAIRSRLIPGTTADFIVIPGGTPTVRSWENPAFKLDLNDPLTQE